MPELRGLVVCVDFADLLAITLPANISHLAECLVVTSPWDKATARLCASIPGVRTFKTDEFYRDGASFNKGRAVESAFDQLGRHGQILIWDADILFPDQMPLPELDRDTLYGATRCMVDNPLEWDHTKPFRYYPRRNDQGRPIGFFQLFHAESRFLANKRPWYDQTFTHAGGGDGYFEHLFPKSHQKILPFDTLHLGPADTNWFGRASRRLDGSLPERSAELKALIRRYHHYKSWAGMRPSGENFPEKIVSADVPQTGHECR